MFKIVASFTRPDSQHEFFNDIYMQFDLIKTLHERARLNQGFLGVDEHVYRDDLRCDKALCFDSQQSFLAFVADNQDLLDQRMAMINEYCLRTNQVYKYYVIET